MAQRLIPAGVAGNRCTGAGGEKAKLYPEQARAGTMTLLAEFQVGCKEPPGNRRSREMIVLRQNAAYRLTRYGHDAVVALLSGQCGVILRQSGRHRLEAQDVTLSR